jgi:hypothetical protein
MRFDLPESIAAMRTGRKKQTRRRSPYWLNKKPGDRITIVHKGEYLGHATVVRAWEHRLGQMREPAAQAEGYKNLMGFLIAWADLYSHVRLSETVYAIEFKDIRWK